MVDLQARPGRAGGAVTILLLQNLCDIFGRKASSVLSLSGPSIVRTGSRKFPFSLGIVFAPSFVNGGGLFKIIGLPFLHAIAMADRIFGSTFTRPLGFNAGRLIAEPFGARRLTLNAHVVGNPAQVVPVFAGATAVVRETCGSGGGSRGVFAPLLLAAQRVGRGTCGTQAGAGVALDHMPVFAGLAREVKAFSNSLGRLALGYSFHRNSNSASTMFIVAQAV